MKLSTAVQHHPSRADLLPDLTRALGGDVEVVEDPEPNGRRSTWRTYALALDRTPDWATHRLIVQDDVVPARNFRPAVEAAIAARPDRLLALWVGGHHDERAALNLAAARGDRWAKLRLPRFLPTVALVWPVRLVCKALCYVESQGWPDAFYADDERLRRALVALDEHVLACVPSLVEHPDVVAPVFGAPARGESRGRVAMYPPGETDPLALDWTSGAS